MSETVRVGDGEIIGDAPDRRVEILCEHPAAHVTWSRFGPRRDGADLHVHHDHTDCFYVLAGEFTLRRGAAGEEVVATAGTAVAIPPGVVHGFRNASAGETRFLNFHFPGVRFVEYMRGLRDGVKVEWDQHDPPADGGRPVAEIEIGSQVPAIAPLTLAQGEQWAPPDGGPAWLFDLETEVWAPAAPCTGPARLLHVRGG